MISYAELEQFYEGLVVKLRDRGVVCAITSGMACVSYGVAQTTRDCDMLCQPEAAGGFFDLLLETRLNGLLPLYRSHITPPLDTRWLRGGWTSHFQWKSGEIEAYLDVFGVAPRASSPWQSDLRGYYANHRLDRVRMKVHERAVRPYMVAVKRDARSDSPTLAEQHECRLEHAERLLAVNPMRAFGLDRLIAEARAEAAKYAPPEILGLVARRAGKLYRFG